MSKVKPIPEGFHTLAPHITVADAAKAIEFYKKALGAKEIGRHAGPGGKIMHAQLQIGDSRLMLNDAFPEMGACGPTPTAGGGAPFTIHLCVEDVDNVFNQAIAAGAKATMPVMDQFWGDRYGKFVDPFGHHWSVATHIKDMTPAEIEAAGQAAMAAMGKH
jgi:PhnB protein